MFDSIGWGEVLVIALAALFIFGPDRLPDLSKDAARALKRLRATIGELRGQVDDALGDEFVELRSADLSRYHPKNFLREHLLGDDEEADPHSDHTKTATE